MGRRVIWAHAAEADLDAAAEYIHRDSPAYAAAYLNHIFHLMCLESMFICLFNKGMFEYSVK